MLSTPALPVSLTRYPLVEVAVHAGGRHWNLTAVSDQDALIRQVRTEADLAAFPFGLMLWPSALALADALPALLSPSRACHVLEIGAGLGLAGFAAASLGARVTQTDNHEDALALCRYNAARNGVLTETRTGDWRNWPSDLPAFDLVIGSDVLYERTLHQTLADLLPRLVARGGKVVLSDPLRPQALEWIEQQERAGFWQVRMTGARVTPPGEAANAAKDAALFTLQRTK